MTPERQKWWDSLPANEKALREVLMIQRFALSIGKGTLSNNKNHNHDAPAVQLLRRQKQALKAIKHELDRITTMVYTGSYEGVSPIYRCEKCGGIIVDTGQWHCPWCGRKIKEWIESQKPDEDYSWVGDEMPLRKKEAK